MQKQFLELNETYNRMLALWDEAVGQFDADALEELEDDFMDAEDELRELFLKWTRRHATAAEYAIIEDIAYTEQFMRKIAAMGSLPES